MAAGQPINPHSADGWEGEMIGGQERRGTGGGGLKR